MNVRAAAALILAAAAIGLLPSRAAAVSLDVGTYYRLRALSYKNLNLQNPKNDRSFLSQNAQVSIGIKDIYLAGTQSEERIDVGIALRGIGIAGSSSTLQAPFDRIGAYYPNTSFTPFIENAYVKTHNILGLPWELTFGQQSYTLGTGMLLSDDGRGFAGVSGKGSLPFWNMKLAGFIFQPRNSQQSSNSLTVGGVTLELPTDGTWQFSGMMEKDKSAQTAADQLAVTEATRMFYSARYQISYGPLVFDGEAALQTGSAKSAGASPGNPTNANIKYKGNAQFARAKWRQSLWAGGEGIARLVVSRGSGDSLGSPTTDEAFFPSNGHRYDGLERVGVGEFFAATPYDAFGGQSTATASGLPRYASGIQSVGIGFTPPAYRGITIDFDYFIFQADRNVGPHRNLGSEFDVRARYRIRDKIQFSASGAFFKIGSAISGNKGTARRYQFEVSGRF